MATYQKNIVFTLEVEYENAPPDYSKRLDAVAEHLSKSAVGLDFLATSFSKVGMEVLIPMLSWKIKGKV